MCWLAWAYIAGIVAALLYNKKHPEVINEELERSKAKGEGAFHVLMKEVLEIHKSMAEKMKEQFWTDENKSQVEKIKSQAMDIFEEYRKKWEVLFSELKEKWKEIAHDGLDKFDSLKDEYVGEIDWLKKKTPTTESFSSKVKEKFQEIESKFKK